MTNVIFIVFQNQALNLGVQYLHSYIQMQGFTSRILFIPNTQQKDLAIAEDFIVRHQPDVLCFSVMSYNFDVTKNFAVRLKDRSPGSRIIFGGIHAMLDPESCLSAADLVVRGEGEETLLEVLNALNNRNVPDLAQISGLVFKEAQGRIINTPIRKPIEKIDSLPYPRHVPELAFITHKGGVSPLKEVYKRYKRYQGKFFYIISSRGCPFSCHFCCNSVFSDLYGSSYLRVRSPMSVIDEIQKEINASKDIVYIAFLDESFLIHSIDWITEFAQAYRHYIRLPFFIKASPPNVNEQKLALLKTAGLNSIVVGLESGSDRINKEIYGRNITAEQFLKAVRLISRFKIALHCDVIMDNPYETEEDRLKTIAVLSKIPKPFVLRMASLVFFPGTKLRKKAVEDGLPAVFWQNVSPISKKNYSLFDLYFWLSSLLPRRLFSALLKHRKNFVIKAMIVTVIYPLTACYSNLAYAWMVARSFNFRIIQILKVPKTSRLHNLVIRPSLNNIWFKKELKPPPVVFFSCAFGLIILHFTFPIKQLIHPPYTYFGDFILVMGIGLRSWVFYLFKKNNLTPYIFQKPKLLLTSGPVRFSRNPMVLGMMMILLGAAFALGSLSAFVTPILYYIFLTLYAIPIEEIALENAFGSQYLEYKQKVRRWL
jgi:radical SAM superfamily enzyme YgiQ (UPF0313 family)/protein-S-isoprenylcysteine O-methyltransferase Ste14